MTPLLEAENVSLSYARSGSKLSLALSNVSLVLHPGEAIAIVGPSGCGKSSLLSLFSGFRRPSSGRVLFQGKEILGPSHERAVIFQDYALFPWKTSVQNIEFALRARGIPRAHARKEALDWLELVQLRGSADLYPRQLSGGMQQRIGIARALAADPQVILLDEPFASLDVITRNSVLQQLLALAQSLKKALVLVTHNIEEALYVGQRVLTMSPGPGTIAHSLSLPLSRPEKIRELRQLPEFQQAERDLYAQLETFPKTQT